MMNNKRKLSLRKASFLKMLQDDFVNKLPIPPAFVNIFGGEMPPWFILEIAGSRKCWRVDIEEDENGSLYLGYGFDCFVKAHSLEMGNFLLFEHENPSILGVKIYEKDGSERAAEIPFESEYEVGAASESPIETQIIHQEINASPCLTSHTMTPVQIRENKKQRGAIKSCNFESEYEVGATSESPTETPIIHQEKNSSQCRTSHIMTQVLLRANKKLRGAIGNGGSGKKKCIVSATEHGLCFSLTWRKAHHFLYYLTIPREMISGKGFSNKDKLKVTDVEGNSWQMELKIRRDGRVDFAQGWREFVNDNNLLDGDKLTFQFTSNNEVQVHVQRASEVNDHSQTEQEGINQPFENINLTCEDEELTDVCTPLDESPLSMGEFENVASTFKSSFSYTWTPKTRNSHLHVPKAIANKQKLENNDTVILCDPKGKQWFMKVKTRQSDGRVGISQGWSTFTKAYGFGAGDTLNFEFVTDRMMKVDVVRASELDHPYSGTIIKQEALTLD